MMRFLPLAFVLAFVTAESARAMCGCMLPPRPNPKLGETKAARIINRTAKVILARDGDTTTMTMANDFEGAPAEFGIVIPVPSIIQKSDVKIVDEKIFVALEEATAPKVQEIFEPDLCELGGSGRGMTDSVAPAAAEAAPAKKAGPKPSDYGVKIESHFFAGEYEIAVLAGDNSAGLVKWLQLFNYEVPDKAKDVLEGYIKQKMHFFVARVYIKEMGTGARTLRPIQVKYTTPKYMLPIRLGMVNADGPQELLAFFLTKTGRVEPTNYRAVRMPTSVAVPGFVKDSWTEVYGAIFAEQEKREDQRVVFVEHASFAPGDWTKAGMPGAFITRAHFKYTEDKFPEDLVLQATRDTAPFQVMLQAMRPPLSGCTDPGAPQRRAREQQQLANLTGWPMDEVLRRAGGQAGTPPNVPPPPDKWWNQLWK